MLLKLEQILLYIKYLLLGVIEGNSNEHEIDYENQHRDAHYLLIKI